MDPRISVIIPCYNGAEYVAGAVESVLAQTFPPHEVIVVDDGSTDDSVARLARFGDSIRILRQSNLGRAAAVAHGIRESTGAWISWLDADDQWHPDKLRASMATLADTGAEVVHTSAWLRYADRDEISRSQGEQIVGHPWRELLSGNAVCCSSVMMSRSAWNETGGFDGRFWPCDDYHLWLRLACRFEFAYVHKPLVYYRKHAAQVSSARVTMTLAKWKAVRDFLSSHPDISAWLRQPERRKVLLEFPIQEMNHYLSLGQTATARQLMRAFIKENPFSAQAWTLFAKSHLPWRLQYKSVQQLGPHVHPEAI